MHHVDSFQHKKLPIGWDYCSEFSIKNSYCRAVCACILDHYVILSVLWPSILGVKKLARYLVNTSISKHTCSEPGTGIYGCFQLYSCLMTGGRLLAFCKNSFNWLFFTWNMILEKQIIHFTFPLKDLHYPLPLSQRTDIMWLYTCTCFAAHLW